MADFRTVQTRMWREDEWFQNLETDARLLWVWMQTNANSDKPWQPLAYTMMMHETGMSSIARLIALIERFQRDGRIEVQGTSRFRVMLSDVHCAACGAGFDMTQDHVTPRSWGGTNSQDNMQWLCRHCNSAKGNRHATRY